MGPHTIEQFVTRRVASNGVLLAWRGSSVKINEYCNGGQMSYAYAQCLKIIQKVAFEFSNFGIFTNFCPIKSDLSVQFPTLRFF